MKLKILIIFIFVLFTCLILTSSFLLNTENNKKTESEELVLKMGDDKSSPISLQMYNIIEKKSVDYNIPRYILYNVAYLETGYRGPFHSDYNPYRTSSAGAEGAMQIITRFAQDHTDSIVSAKDLRYNIELNINVSCSMLSRLYNRYKNWDVVLGYYNTGYPQVNSYAIYASNNKNYKSNWIKL